MISAMLLMSLTVQLCLHTVEVLYLRCFCVVGTFSGNLTLSSFVAHIEIYFKGEKLTIERTTRDSGTSFQGDR